MSNVTDKSITIYIHVVYIPETVYNLLNPVRHTGW